METQHMATTASRIEDQSPALGKLTLCNELHHQEADLPVSSFGDYDKSNQASSQPVTLHQQPVDTLFPQQEQGDAEQLTALNSASERQQMTQHLASKTASGQGSQLAGASAEQQPQQPASFIISHNVAKKHNIGTIARSATAFGVKEVCLVGARQYNTFGSHGSDAFVAFRHFNTLDSCIKHLKEAEGCEIVGVEITDQARPVHELPFKGPTAFMLGNEGQGLSAKQMALCDSFVYIPQYGCGTASLNVAVAASIVLHHFALWAGYSEHRRDGFKFVVPERPQRTLPRGMVRSQDDAARSKSSDGAADDDDGSWMQEQGLELFDGGA